jgi:hypothetical protein
MECAMHHAALQPNSANLLASLSRDPSFNVEPSVFHRQCKRSYRRSRTAYEKARELVELSKTGIPDGTTVGSNW